MVLRQSIYVCCRRGEGGGGVLCGWGSKLICVDGRGWGGFINTQQMYTQPTADRLGLFLPLSGGGRLAAGGARSRGGGGGQQAVGRELQRGANGACVVIYYWVLLVYIYICCKTSYIYTQSQSQSPRPQTHPPIAPTHAPSSIHTDMIRTHIYTNVCMYISKLLTQQG